MTDWILHEGDNRIALAGIGSNTLDSCVTDPPYHLLSTVKRFANSPRTESTMPKADVYRRSSVGFMGKTWDGGDLAFQPDFWAEVLRVLKPGAFLCAFGATRGYHRMACAIEDAGFEIRDSLAWLYGTGFPKSHDVSKGIDKAVGAERTEILRTDRNFGKSRLEDGKNAFGDYAGKRDVTAPATPQAAEWDGWGTALKPAFEPIVLARKPLSESTVAANVLRWRTGALNIGGCRVDAGGETVTTSRNIALGSSDGGIYGAATVPGVYEMPKGGRWPANVVHDGSDEVVGMFPNSAGQLADARNDGAPKTGSIYGKMKHRDGEVSAERRYTENGSTNYARRPRQDSFGDEGSAARFFYSAKASKADRAGSKHPTVKPIALMQWLARLVTPPGGTVLDPFAGSGTTAAAALREGFRAVLCEREAEYIVDIRRRLGGPARMPWEPAPAFPWTAP